MEPWVVTENLVPDAIYAFAQEYMLMGLLSVNSAIVVIGSIDLLNIIIVHLYTNPRNKI